MKPQLIQVRTVKPGSWIRRNGSPVEVTEIVPLSEGFYRVSTAGLQPWERWTGLFEGHWLVEVVADAAPEVVAA